MKNTRNWFKRKRYGYGWIPSTPKGWLLTFAYLASIMVPTLYLPLIMSDSSESEVALYIIAIVLVASFIFIGLISRNAPKPKWRWGKSESDNPTEDF